MICKLWKYIKAFLNEFVDYELQRKHYEYIGRGLSCYINFDDFNLPANSQSQNDSADTGIILVETLLVP